MQQNTDKEKIPLSIRQSFLLECVTNQYPHLQQLYIYNTAKSRSKSINLPINELGIGRKSFSFVACKIYNELPNTLKNLECNEKTLKNTLNTKKKANSILKPIGLVESYKTLNLNENLS